MKDIAELSEQTYQFLLDWQPTIDDEDMCALIKQADPEVLWAEITSK